jgi:ParB family protein of integrating conjugative element (PFGI_1 class)
MRAGANISSAMSLAPTSEFDGSVTILRITDIRPYDKNPRQAANPLFETIKASIRQRGMEAPLKVTRRPGIIHYVVAAGGNTRLLAQLELWQETADPRFETVPVVVKAWRSESDVLAGHLIENEQRADLSFWDKARGVVVLKSELERERETTLSLRQWEAVLADLGLQMSKDVLATCLFAVERLSVLGSMAASLSRNDVRDYLQPGFRRLGRLAQKFGLGEAALYAHTLDPLMQRWATEGLAFSAQQLVADGEAGLAQALQITVSGLQAMLALLDESPEIALTELQLRGKDNVEASASTQPSGARRTSRPQQTSNHPADTVVTGDTLVSVEAPTRAYIQTVSAGDSERPEGIGTPTSVSPGDSERPESIGTHTSVSPGDSEQPEGIGTHTSPAAPVVDPFRAAVFEAANATNVADCVRWRDDLPWRFYVEVPTAPLDLKSVGPRRHAGWWLLALVSRQLDPELTRLLPESSGWRRMVGTDREWDEKRLPLLVHTELGGPISAHDLVTWLVRRPDVAAAAAWRCLELARAIGAAHSHGLSPTLGRPGSTA